jgi:TP901 family phage tail tape measure protein
VSGGAQALTQLDALDARLKGLPQSAQATVSGITAAGQSMQQTAVHAATLERAALDLGTALTPLPASFTRITSAGLSLGGVTPAMAAVTVGVGALTAAVGASVEQAMEFQRVMGSLDAVLPVRDVQQFGGALSDLALTLGRDTVFSANEAAAGLQSLARQGVSTQDILGGVAVAATNMAAAMGTTPEHAALVLGAAMREFNLSADQATHVADQFSAAVHVAGLSAETMGSGVSRVAPVVNALGGSLDDVITGMELLARSGINANRSGTMLAQLYEDVVNPRTKEAAALMQQLGLITADGSNKFIDASGKVKSFADIARILGETLNQLTPAQMAATTQTEFSRRAMEGALVIANAYKTGGLDKLIEAQDNARTSAEAMNARLDNLWGDTKQLQSSIGTLAVEIGDDLSPSLRAATQDAKGLVDGLTSALKAYGDWRNRNASGQGITGTPAQSSDIFTTQQTITQDLQDQLYGAAPSLADSLVNGLAAQRIGERLSGTLSHETYLAGQAATEAIGQAVEDTTPDVLTDYERLVDQAGAILKEMGGNVQASIREAVAEAPNEAQANTLTAQILEQANAAKALQEALATLTPTERAHYEVALAQSNAQTVLNDMLTAGTITLDQYTSALERGSLGLEKQAAAHQRATTALQQYQAALQAQTQSTDAATVASGRWGEALEQFISGSLSKLPRAVAASVQAFQNLGASGITPALHAIADAWHVSFDELLQAIASGQGQAFEQAHGVGQAIVQGLQAGVEGDDTNFQGSISLLVGEALDATKQRYSISSPSQVFAEQVGKPLVQGIAAGARAAAPELIAALSDILQSSIGAARQAVGGAAQQGQAFFGRLLGAQYASGQGGGLADSFQPYVVGQQMAQGFRENVGSGPEVFGSEIATGFNTAVSAGMPDIWEVGSRVMARSLEGTGYTMDPRGLVGANVAYPLGPLSDELGGFGRAVESATGGLHQMAQATYEAGLAANRGAFNPGVYAQPDALTAALLMGPNYQGPQPNSVYGYGGPPSVDVALTWLMQSRAAQGAAVDANKQTVSSGWSANTTGGISGYSQETINALTAAGITNIARPIDDMTLAAGGFLNATDSATKATQQQTEAIQTSTDLTVEQANALDKANAQIGSAGNGFATFTAGTGAALHTVTIQATLDALKMGVASQQLAAVVDEATARWKAIAANAEALQAGQMVNAGVAGGKTAVGLTTTQIYGNTATAGGQPTNIGPIPIVAPLTPGTLRGFADGPMVPVPSYLTDMATGRTYGKAGEYGPEPIGYGLGGGGGPVTLNLIFQGPVLGNDVDKREFWNPKGRLILQSLRSIGVRI